MKKIYNYFLVISFVGSFGFIIGCEDEVGSNNDQTYIKTTDSLTTSMEHSVDSLENKADDLDDALEDLSEAFDNEI